MSWQDRLNTVKFEIVTGDGISWNPLLIPIFDKHIEYNGTQYDFIDKAGSFFIRKFPKGRSFLLEFAFQGVDNDINAGNFDISARDRGSWKVTHPLYGQFHCQPLSLSMNNSGLNTTIIKCQVIESRMILQDVSSVQTEPRTKVNNTSLLVNTKAQTFLTVSPVNKTIKIKDLQNAIKQTTIIGETIKGITKLDSELKSYSTLFSSILNELNNYSAITAQYLTSIQALISLPANVASNIGSRINCLESLLSSTYNSILGVANISYFQKIFYNLIGVTIVSKMCDAVTVQNDGDLQTRVEVLFYLNKIQSDYNKFLKNLDSLNFTSDHDLMFAINEQVYSTVFYLYSILFQSKQERTFYCDKDTNLIILAHRLYGSATEENIQTVKTNNKIGISELLNIKKGRPVLYYV
jgi:hypothetical protein